MGIVRERGAREAAVWLVVHVHVVSSVACAKVDAVIYWGSRQDAGLLSVLLTNPCPLCRPFLASSYVDVQRR